MALISRASIDLLEYFNCPLKNRKILTTKDHEATSFFCLCFLIIYFITNYFKIFVKEFEVYLCMVEQKVKDRRNKSIEYKNTVMSYKDYLF